MLPVLLSLTLRSQPGTAVGLVIGEFASGRETSQAWDAMIYSDKS